MIAEQNQPRIWTIIWVFGVYLLLSLLFQIVSIVWDVTTGNDFLDMTVTWHSELFGLTAMLIALIFAKWQRIRFFRWERISWKGFVFAFIVMIAAIGISSVIDYLGQNFTSYTNTQNEILLDDVYSQASWLLSFLSIVIIAPFVEEIIFRGFLMQQLFRNRLWLGWIVSSLLFCAAHVPTDWVSFLLYLIPGIALGGILYKTRRLELTIFAHFLNNFIAFIWT
ncbi:CPBP family intramembrane metalloprotease [Listeria grandensis]|uniref:CPBP family intramembrane metalloprotease n=1 Tax=Listeria grandensis TaxID=1494963 RepID=A0A7X0Y2D5_9LIST|nr:CPBP family intramembrane glutamic endopeptidase [Listeria grandensis]MBC1474608.1 CPBP family intramembrane metalloprotease [Listeria grandensis]MBC1935735.1 CPBP family intramembrane metalloprotease [Listeria grandensis]